MTFNLADLFENAVDAFGDREYLVVEGQRRTYAEMEERANRLAHHLAANGIGPGDHVGIYSLNTSNGWRRPGPSSSCGRCGSTSTSGMSKTSSGTCSPTPTSRLW